MKPRLALCPALAVLLLLVACAAPPPVALPPLRESPPPLPPPLPIRFSHGGRLLTHDILGFGPANLHIHAAIHGNEPEGIELARRLQAELEADPSLRRGLRVIFVNPANPDGLAAKTRYNAKGVDLNRNFPARNWRRLAHSRLGGSGPAPLSEPETKALVELVERYPPVLVVSLHSAAHCVNWDGPCADLARTMAHLTGYRLAPTIGYPTPGSLGSWLGKDRGVPVITLELHRVGPDRLWQENRQALLAAVRWAARREAPGIPRASRRPGSGSG